MDDTKKIKSLLGSKHNRKLYFNRESEVVFIYVFLIAFMIFGSIMSPHFLSERNIHNLISKNAGLLFVTFGQMFVILLGGVDLSTGSVISVVNVLCVALMREGNPATYLLTLAVAIAVGVGVGLFNGLLVTKGGIQPIIATLASSTILNGVALLIQPKPGGQLPRGISNFIAKGWNFLFPTLLVLVITCIMWILLNRTRTGRNIIAVGGNEISAKSSGIYVNKTKVKAFVICSVMAAVAGLYLSAYSKSGSPILGDTYTQNSITAAVVGGANLAGGKASVIGCIAAALILGIVNNILNLMHISSYYQYVLTGVILMVALTISAIRSIRK